MQRGSGGTEETVFAGLGGESDEGMSVAQLFQREPDS